MGARSGGGGGAGLGSRQATFQKGMAALQSKYSAAVKTYNSIKKGLPKGGPISASYGANKIMAAKGLKTPSEIKQQIADYTKNFNWGGKGAPAF